MLEANEMMVLQKQLAKKRHGIRSQQIRESCGIQPVNEWVERKEWDDHVIRMDEEKLVKISKDNIHAGRR